jgi:SAM-dependent methyltransferase
MAVRATERQTDDYPPRLNLGAGDDTDPGRWDVDIRDGPGIDQVVDLDEMPWPWPDETFGLIQASHVLEHLDSVGDALAECARVLRPGGFVEVHWPVGMNERADPDHAHRWVWDTPLYYCGERAWDRDVGLAVVNRSVDVHVHLNGVSRWLYRRWIAMYRRRHGPGRWLFDLPATSGEFTVVFEK